MVKTDTATWRLWMGLALGAFGTLSAGFSIYSNFTLIILSVSVLVVILALVQLSLWSRLRRSWL
jgi:hypothetical protein